MVRASECLEKSLDYLCHICEALIFLNVLCAFLDLRGLKEFQLMFEYSNASYLWDSLGNFGGAKRVLDILPIFNYPILPLKNYLRNPSMQWRNFAALWSVIADPSREGPRSVLPGVAILEG